MRHAAESLKGVHYVNTRLLTSALCVIALVGFSQLGHAATTGVDQGTETFVKTAGAAGMGEVEKGNTAIKKSTNQDVLNFAQTIVKDHSDANAKLMALAREKGITLEENAGRKPMHEKMMNATGAEFDKMFMEHQIKDHVAAVGLFETYARDGQDPDIKKFAADTKPHLEHHLKMARDISERLSMGTSFDKNRPVDVKHDDEMKMNDKTRKPLY